MKERRFMIDPKELRIGNIVEGYEDGSLAPEDIEASYYGEWKHKPVALTEEWLERFGFKFEIDDSDEYWNKQTWYIHDGIALVKESEDLYLMGYEWQDNRKPLKYAHQLQNLYYALTGKELTYES